MVLKNDLKKALKIKCQNDLPGRTENQILRSPAPNPPPTTYVVLVWVLDAENKHQVDLTHQAR